MLQQTQVATVIGYFNNFIAHFPDIKTLANADIDAVLAQWAGLGYYARARNLHQSAQIIMAQHQGRFPEQLAAVMALPGVGESTAGAILSLSFNQPQAILDGNVKRVLSRYHQVQGHYQQSATLKALWRLARTHTPATRNNEYTQAIMDLGATICTRSQPKCELCPMRNNCLSCQQQTQDQYPEAKPKKAKPHKTTAALIFAHQGQIYLEQRPSQGIWGGLYSLPECEDTKQIINDTIAAFDKQGRIVHTLPVLKHSFTHYHLHIRPIVVELGSVNHKLHVPTTQELGIPRPIQTILQQVALLFESGKGETLTVK